LIYDAEPGDEKLSSGRLDHREIGSFYILRVGASKASRVKVLKLIAMPSHRVVYDADADSTGHSFPKGMLSNDAGVFLVSELQSASSTEDWCSVPINDVDLKNTTELYLRMCKVRDYEPNPAALVQKKLPNE